MLQIEVDFIYDGKFKEKKKMNVDDWESVIEVVGRFVKYFKTSNDQCEIYPESKILLGTEDLIKDIGEHVKVYGSKFAIIQFGKKLYKEIKVVQSQSFAKISQSHSLTREESVNIMEKDIHDHFKKYLTF